MLSRAGVKRHHQEKGKKRLINRFLVHALGLSQSQVGRLFSPHYDPEKVAEYLRKNGYSRVWLIKRGKMPH